MKNEANVCKSVSSRFTYVLFFNKFRFIKFGKILWGTFYLKKNAILT